MATQHTWVVRHLRLSSLPVLTTVCTEASSGSRKSCLSKRPSTPREPIRLRDVGDGESRGTGSGDKLGAGLTSPAYCKARKANLASASGLV